MYGMEINVLALEIHLGVKDKCSVLNIYFIELQFTVFRINVRTFWRGSLKVIPPVTLEHSFEVIWSLIMFS